MVANIIWLKNNISHYNRCHFGLIFISLPQKSKTWWMMIELKRSFDTAVINQIRKLPPPKCTCLFYVWSAMKKKVKVLYSLFLISSGNNTFLCCSMLAITSPFWHKREGKRREIVILSLFPSYRTINRGRSRRKCAIPDCWNLAGLNFDR